MSTAAPAATEWSDDLVARMARHRAELFENGYTIIEDLLDDAMIARVRGAVDRLGGGDFIPGREQGFTGRRVAGVVAQDKVFQDLAMIEETRYLLNEALGEGYLLTTNTSIEIAPGEQHGPLHTDELFYTDVVPHPHPPIVCNTMWAIDDFTPENGATRVVPGSQSTPFPAGSLTEMSGDNDLSEEIVQAVMPRGSVLVFLGSIWHTGGSNNTDTGRLGIALNYCAGWVRPETANILTLPLDEVRELPSHIQKILGFGLYKNFIGHLEMGPPLEALAAQGR